MAGNGGFLQLFSAKIYQAMKNQLKNNISINKIFQEHH
jgi:hypothetical protein